MTAVRETGHPPLVRAVLLLGCHEAADEVGVDLDPIFEAHGIDPRLLDSPNGFLDKRRIVNFLEAVAREPKCQSFGFLVGKYQAPIQFGPPGQLVKLAPTLRAALENVVRYVELYTQAVKYELVIEGDRASFSRANTYQYDTDPVQLNLIGLMQVFKLFRSLCGDDWQPTSIYFEHSAPSRDKQLEEYFGAPVYFGRSFDGIVFPAEDLDRSIPTANKELLQIVEAYFSPQLSDNQPATGVLSGTTDFIRRKIGTRLCNLESCAQHLHMHPRRLQRELAESGHTFKALTLVTRMEIARDYLQKSDIRLSELADMLGYDNPSAFSRAFKSQHGVAPLNWKKQLPNQ